MELETYGAWYGKKVKNQMRRSGNQIIHSVALDFGPYVYV